MYQLKALVWKAYKVRARSPFSTALDLFGPLVVVVVFLSLKAVLSSISNDQNQLVDGQQRGIFRNFQTPPLDQKANLPRHLCTKVLFFSFVSGSQRQQDYEQQQQQQQNDTNTVNTNSTSNSTSDTIQTLIGRECGIELVPTNSRDDLIGKLQKSLNDRINYKKEGADLNKYNTTNTCDQVGYQAGIVFGPKNHQLELHLTDVQNNPIIYHPFTQGSVFSVFRFSHGDLNSGSYLLETCIGVAYERLHDRNKKQDNFDNTSLSLASITFADDDNNDSNDTNTNTTRPNSGDLQWRIEAFPNKTTPQIITLLFLVFILLGNLCNGIATCLRAADDNESGFHHYIRCAGVPAGIYWSSQMIIIIIHMIAQSLIIATLLAIPTSDILFDPIYDASITFRWLILLTYSLSLNAYAMFWGSLIYKGSRALLYACLAAVCFAVYPALTMLEWNPYTFTSYSTLNTLFMLNPVSNFNTMIIVLYALSMNLSGPLKWSQLSTRLPKAAISQWSLGELWLILLIQGIFWFLATILVDQYMYSSEGGYIPDIDSFINELCCCNALQPVSDNYNKDELLVESRSKVVPSEFKSKTAQSKKDPNRVCCYLRNLSIIGPNIFMAQNKGNSWRLTAEQLEKLKLEERMATKSNQYLISRSQTKHFKSPNSSQISNQGSQRVQTVPIFLDDSILQHIVWRKSRVSLEHVNLDFHFNQVSFILGQTSTKDLFFSSLLGLRKLDSGFIVLDDVKYTRSDINLARPNVGYLSDKDIFLPELSIFENLQFFGSLRDPSYRAYESESLFVLSLLHLMRRRDSSPSVLTSRSSRKLALAVAAVGHTKLLLLVEPTLNLRWRPRCQVLNLLKKYKSIRSIIVDTSDVDEATAFGDRIVLFKNNQAYFDGSPEYLTKKLSCGHWLVFESIKRRNGNSISGKKLSALELLTSEIFKNDKINQLDPTTRSVYQEIMKAGSKEAAETASGVSSKVNSSQGLNENKSELHKSTVILKVKQSPNSDKALCYILKLFANNSIVHDFRLTELTFESLEDIIVLQMSRAIYPDLPPDLLLSLQHRIHKHPDSNQYFNVQQWSTTDRTKAPKIEKPIDGSDLISVFKDRISNRNELLILLGSSILALIIVAFALWELESSLYSQKIINTNSSPDLIESGSKQFKRESLIDDYSLVEKIYRHRMAVYFVGDNSSNVNTSSASISEFISNKDLVGFADQNMRESDKVFVSKIIQTSRDLVSSIVFFDPKSNEATIVFDPQLTHCMIAGIRTFSRYHFELKKEQNNITRSQQVNRFPTIARFGFHHDWFEITGGYMARRLFYGLGFAVAEGIALGALVIAPNRHKTESSLVKPVRLTYWLWMALFDLCLSCILVAGYIILIILFEKTYSPYLIFFMVLVLVLYKLSAIPVAYVVSLVVDSKRIGFFFLLFVLSTIGWAFSVNLRTFVEWFVFNEGYTYMVADKIFLSFQISSLIDALVDINHINRMDTLCGTVPAFTPTVNIIPLEGAQTPGLTDKIMKKVRECLANGKSGISTNFASLKEFGILWDIYLIILFGIIYWFLLLFTEKFFSISSRRFGETLSSNDPLKTVVRSHETATSLFRWNKEKDRLVSEYIRCLNEVKYVKQMSSHCIYLRIWLRPMGDQSSIETRIAKILEPLFNLGQPKNEVSVELKTTLQLFIRLGSESSRFKADKIQLIEAYADFIRKNPDIATRFAVVDWTREMLYKILLHGHYNTKSVSAVT